MAAFQKNQLNGNKEAMLSAGAEEVKEIDEPIMAFKSSQFSQSQAHAAFEQLRQQGIKQYISPNQG